MKDELVLSIKPKEETARVSVDYQIKLDDWELGFGVSKVTLEMDASERPKLIIECYPSRVKIDGVDVETLIKDKSKGV